MLYRTMDLKKIWQRFRLPKLRVLCLNAWMVPRKSKDVEKRFGRIVQVVLRQKPDLLLLQELWTNRMKDWAEGLLLPFFSYCIRPDEKQALVTGRWGSGLLVFSNLDVLQEEYLTFPEKARNVVDTIVQRGFQRIKLKWGSSALTVVNTHLSAFRDYESIRLSQLANLNSKLEQDRAPILIGGDFNMTPTSKAYGLFTKDFGWQDLPAGVPGGEVHTWQEANPYHDHSEPNSRLDYFFGKGVGVGGYEVLNETMSDHQGILIELTRKG